MVLAHLALCVLGASPCPAPLTFEDLTARPGPYAGACRIEGPPVALVEGGQARLSVLLPADAPVVIRTAVETLNRALKADAGVGLPVRDPSQVSGLAPPCILPVWGEDSPYLARLRRAGFEAPLELGAQGFAVERLAIEGVPVLVVWSPAPIGCRYGILELLRSLEIESGAARTRLERVVARPHFPLRIYYLNFAEHLQNRYNVNFVYDTPTNTWNLDQWRRFIDMLAAMRYNVFEFWLVPTLFDPSALEGSEHTERFAETMCEVIRYAHTQGLLVEMLQAVNTVGPEWRYYCPNVPEERAMLLRLWEFWTRRLDGVDILGLFPGDPGGCTRNGCDYRTYIDLCAEIAERTHRARPELIYDIGTWGTPFWGWGVDAWEGGPERARDAFAYYGERLAAFPRATFTDINLGLNADSLGAEGGGEGEPYVRSIGALRPVATWDYAASEGEGTVIPRFRVARILDRRQREARLPYVGGINYTMSPALNQIQAFATAECFWNPDRTVEGLVESYARLAFGPACAEVGMRVFPYTEVVWDWGGGGWSGGEEALARGLAEARSALAACTPAREGALALFPPPAEARAELLWHVEVLARLARAGWWIEQARGTAAEIAGTPPERVTLASARQALAENPAADGAVGLAELVRRIEAADLPGLRRDYWSHVYGIYDETGRPVDPRAWGATAALFDRFGYRFVEPEPEEAGPPVLLHNHPSRLAELLARRDEPSLALDLGNATSEKGWELTGWPLAGVFDEESWRTSTDAPGIARLRDFRDDGYRWLVVRVTDDTCGGRKSFHVNGRLVGEWLRPATGLRWTTQQYELPADLVLTAPLELRVTESGVALADLALTRSPLTEAELAQLEHPAP